MKLVRYVSFVLAVMCCGFFASAETDYILGPGDHLQIKVYGHDDLTSQVILGSDGNIAMQFVGQIRASGKTPPQLADRIRQGLAGDYIIDPIVSVIIARYRNFYIQGEVIRPSGYPYEPGMDVRKAIALAGGLTNRGSEDKVEWIPETSADKNPQDVELSQEIKPGDIIIVGQRFF